MSGRLAGARRCSSSRHSGLTGFGAKFGWEGLPHLEAGLKRRVGVSGRFEGAWLVRVGGASMC